MLNLEVQSFVFTVENRTYLNSLFPHNSDQWSINTVPMNNVKRQIKEDLLSIQSGQCAYCIQDLDSRTRNEEDLQLDGDREHIAAKTDYPQFMFTEANLVLSCITCNRALKNDLDIVMSCSNNYEDCEFQIVHPYFDNFEEHIEFDEEFIICRGYITQKGLFTINTFDLIGPYLTKKRAEKVMLNIFLNNRTLSPEKRQLIEDALRYTG